MDAFDKDVSIEDLDGCFLGSYEGFDDVLDDGLDFTGVYII